MTQTDDPVDVAAGPAALDVHHTPETRPGRQAVLVLASDLAGTATDAIDVVVYEAQLFRRPHRLIGLSHLAADGLFELLLVDFPDHGRLTCPGGR